MNTNTLNSECWFKEFNSKNVIFANAHHFHVCMTWMNNGIHRKYIRALQDGCLWQNLSSHVCITHHVTIYNVCLLYFCRTYFEPHSNINDTCASFKSRMKKQKYNWLRHFLVELLIDVNWAKMLHSNLILSIWFHRRRNSTIFETIDGPKLQFTFDHR